MHHQPRRTQGTRPRRQLAWQHYPYKGKQGRYICSTHIFICICRMRCQIKAFTCLFSPKPQPQYQPNLPGCQACHADCGLRRCPGFPGWMPGWATEETEKSLASNRERISFKSWNMHFSFRKLAPHFNLSKIPCINRICLLIMFLIEGLMWTKCPSWSHVRNIYFSFVTVKN